MRSFFSLRLKPSNELEADKANLFDFGGFGKTTEFTVNSSATSHFFRRHMHFTSFKQKFFKNKNSTVLEKL